VLVTCRATILIAALPLAWACASSGGQPGRTTSRVDQYVITAEELATANASNLYDAIRQLRPQWLQSAGPTTFRADAEYQILVYMDRIRFGEPTMLRSVPVALPQSVRWLSASEAQAEFGVGNLQGAIQIVTRRTQ
jgi:hypothetical protein